MKKVFSIFWLVLLVLSLAVTTYASKDPLDEIQNYTIDIDMLQNGDAKVTYHFDWKVLDSESEGPLEYLYVGIPNKHISNILAISDNIKDIDYSSSSDKESGSFAKIYFHRKYYKDEEFSFDFSLEQGYLYILNDDGTVTYGFTPGWFPEIEIKNLEVKWNGNYVVSHNADTIDEWNRLVWKTSLGLGETEKLSCEVIYPQSRFEELPESRQSTHANDLSGEETLLIVVLVVIGIFVIFILIAALSDDGYGGGGRSTVFISSGGGRSCACASSCACACACAGGGRAGCSAKNIYGVDIAMIQKATENVKKQKG